MTSIIAECFIYPRLLLNAVIGYDFGYFVHGKYLVTGNTKTAEQAEVLLNQWAAEKGRAITIIHEQEPSGSKNLKDRTAGEGAR